MKYLNGLLSLVLLALLSGCANLAPVRTFADETRKLSAAFDPMLGGSKSTCMEKYRWKKMLTSAEFDPAAAESSAAQLCGSIDEDSKVIADINALVELYADTLAALADEKLPTYKEELDGLTASLGNLKKPGSADPLVAPEKLGAVASLVEFLSRVATQRMQQNAIRELIDHQAAFNTVTGALSDYASLNYMAWLKDQENEIQILNKALNASEKKEMLAARYLKTLLLAEQRQVAGRKEAVNAFVQSVAELQKTNAELRAKFDRMDDKDLLRQLFKLSKEVARLRKQVNAAF